MEDICIRTLYKRVMICSPSAACNFLLALKRRPYICEHVRTLSMLMAEFGQPCNMTEAIEVIRAEPKTKRLLKAGSVKVQSLVAMSILHRLPRLWMLGVSDTVLRLTQRWPETKIVGSSLVALMIKNTDYTRAPTGACRGPYDWMDSFGPGQLPASLLSLSLEHTCAKGCRAGAPPHDWATVAASLTFLGLNAPASSSALTQILQHCRNLKHLVVSDSTLSIEAIVDGISACRPLESSLFSTNIVPINIGQLIVTDCNRMLSSFSRFTKLESLIIPMAVKMPDSAPSLRLPPNLSQLILSWRADVFNPYWRSTFPNFMSNAVKAGRMPKTLQEIIFDWEDDLLDTLQDLDFHYFEQVLPLFHATCSSKGIRFVHRHWAARRDLTTQEMVAILRGAAKRKSGGQPGTQALS